MAREASGGLPDPPTTLLALGDIRTGSPESPIARKPPEAFRNDQKHFFYGQVNSQDEIYDPDHMAAVEDVGAPTELDEIGALRVHT